jgi:hypothetical protein
MYKYDMDSCVTMKPLSGGILIWEDFFVWSYVSSWSVTKECMKVRAERVALRMNESHVISWRCLMMLEDTKILNANTTDENLTKSESQFIKNNFSHLNSHLK